MAVTRTDVKKIAELARLRFEDAELDRFTQEMNEILRFVEKLKEVDTDHVEPLYHVWECGNVMRDDIPKPSLSQEEALANAPARDSQFFLVPRVIE